MKTLQEIKDLAKEHDACVGNYKKFYQFLEEGKEKEAWQIVWVNVVWMNNRGAELDVLEVERLAGGVGKIYSESGQICFEGNYKDGKLDGLSRWYYESGKLWFERNYKNGVRIN
jgi:antitoxin component YwqK of YwqJK toxin-antitoxin module